MAEKKKKWSAKKKAAVALGAVGTAAAGHYLIGRHLRGKNAVEASAIAKRSKDLMKNTVSSFSPRKRSESIHDVVGLILDGHSVDDAVAELLEWKALRRAVRGGWTGLKRKVGRTVRAQTKHLFSLAGSKATERAGTTAARISGHHYVRKLGSGSWRGIQHIPGRPGR